MLIFVFGQRYKLTIWNCSARGSETRFLILSLNAIAPTSSQVQGRQTPQLTQRINTHLTVAAKQRSRCIAFFFRKIQHRHLFVTGALPTNSRLRISSSSFSGKARASQPLSVGRSHAAGRISRLGWCFANSGTCQHL
jgi:hypothetical protein